jgi:hypothetical protein
MTQIPARADVPAGALELLGEKGGAERALTAALASFQEQVQPRALPSAVSWSTSVAATSCGSR